MVVSTAKMSGRQFLLMGQDPPGVRLELVDGEIAVSASPTPKHSYTVMMLATIVNSHVRQQNLGEFHHDVDTLLDEYNVRRPDLLFFSNQNRHRIGEKFMEGPPDLAIEVISPSSVEIDRSDKFKQYRSAKVVHYWIVDPERKTLDAWELKRSKYIPAGCGRDDDVIRLEPFPMLDIPLKELWRK